MILIESKPILLLYCIFYVKKLIVKTLFIKSLYPLYDIVSTPYFHRGYIFWSKKRSDHYLHQNFAICIPLC